MEVGQAVTMVVVALPEEVRMQFASSGTSVEASQATRLNNINLF
jgi:hypothetical protein